MTDSSSLLDRLRASLGQCEPLARVAEVSAAVAVVFRRGSPSGDEFLLIRRAEREGDPWSGQIAFPGGRVKAEDASFAATAARETLEEVGVDLSGALFLGYMEAFEPNNRRIVVVPAVFLLIEPVEVTLGPEVRSHRWVRAGDLLSAENHRHRPVTVEGTQRLVPSFQFGDYLVWGLTDRILTRLGKASSDN